MSTELNNIDLTPNQRKAVAELLKRYIPDTEVWAYGSRVKFSSTPKSDLDLVAFATPEQKRAISNLKEAFEESSLPFRVDLFIWNEVPEQFHKNIEAERVVFQKKNETLVMGSEWRKGTLSDVAEVLMGQSPPGIDCAKDPIGLPLLNGPTEFGAHSPTATQYTRNPKRMSKEGDLLFCVRGSTTGRMNWSDRKYALGRGLAAIRHLDQNCQQYLRGVIDHKLEELLSVATGSTFPNISRNQILGLELNIPPLLEQKAIAHILGSLDDKIELNRRMNETLEGMAQVLFKSWFVDFDPVIDNALVAGNPIPDKLAERAQVRSQALANGTANREAAKQFLAAFQLTEEMGWIPEKWETQRLYDIANFINGAAYKGSDFADNPDAIPVIKIAEIKNGISGQTKFTYIVKDGKYRISDGEILLSWSGNPDTSIDTFVWTGGEGWLNQHIFKVSLRCEEERFFVYYQLKILRSVFAEIARDKQTTGLGHFTGADMKRLFVFKPRTEVLTEFNKTAASLYQRYYQNRLAEKTLTKLRDTLLPKLISGELRIPDAEKLVEDVL